MLESRSFLIALMLFCTSMLTSIVCYARVQLERTTDNGLIEELPQGESDFIFKNNGICFGSLSMKTVEKIGEITIDGIGFLRIAWQGSTIPLKAEIHAEFNALRQLGGSYVRVTSENSQLTLSTINVRPITLKARWKAGEQLREAQLTLPGPILIKKSERGGYFISGQVQETSRQGMQLVSNQPIMKMMTVEKVTGAEGATPVCGDEPENSLNLDPIVNFLRGIGNSFPMQLP